MKLTKKRVKEILSVLGFQAAAEIEEGYCGPRFRLGIMLIEFIDCNEKDDSVCVEIKLNKERERFFFLKKPGMYWQIEINTENYYDKESGTVEEKVLGKTYSYFTENNNKVAGYYDTEINTFHIFDNWIPGQVKFDWEMKFAEILKCDDSDGWSFTKLGKYYQIEDKTIL